MTTEINKAHWLLLETISLLLVMKIVQQIRSIQWFVLVMCQPKSRDMSDDVHDGCYPGSSTCGEDVDNTRGRGNDKGEDGRDTLVKDGRVGPGDIRNDATGHGKAGDGVLVGDDSADGSVAEDREVTHSVPTLLLKGRDVIHSARQQTYTCCPIKVTVEEDAMKTMVWTLTDRSTI